MTEGSALQGVAVTVGGLKSSRNAPSFDANDVLHICLPLNVLHIKIFCSSSPARLSCFPSLVSFSCMVNGDMLRLCQNSAGRVLACSLGHALACD